MSTRVLVVESDPEARARLGEWLEIEGFDVIECPGPSGPEYTCIGSRTQHCPLADAVDVVVLDLALAGDAVLDGTPTEELLAYYSWAGRGVVALHHLRDAPPDTTLDTVVVQSWPPDRETLIGAIEELARPAVGAVD